MARSDEEVLDEIVDDDIRNDEVASDRSAPDTDASDDSAGRLAGLFSLKTFLLSAALIGVGVIGGGAIPIVGTLGSLGGLFVATFAVGLVAAERRYLETAVAGEVSHAQGITFGDLRNCVIHRPEVDIPLTRNAVVVFSPATADDVLQMDAGNLPGAPVDRLGQILSVDGCMSNVEIHSE